MSVQDIIYIETRAVGTVYWVGILVIQWSFLRFGIYIRNVSRRLKREVHMIFMTNCSSHDS